MMGLIKNLWRKLSRTRALDQSSGELETLFFESSYRVTYIMGLSSADPDFSYLLYSYTVKTLIVLLIGSVLWFGLTESTSLDDIAATVNVTVIQFITLYRYRNMVEHRDFYKKLASSMKSPHFDISTEKRKELVKYWARANEKYLKLLLTLGNCTLAAWYIFPLLDDVEYNLIVTAWLPFNYKTPVLYPVAYVSVILIFNYVSHFVMVTDLVTQTHLLHLLCQLHVLDDCFQNLLNECRIGFEDVAENNLVFNESFVDKYTKRLAELIQQHKFILSNIMQLRHILSGPMLGQLAASGTLICFIGYQATTTLDESIGKFLMSFLFLGYNVFELYIICRWSEEITNACQHIGDAIYCSGWECGLTRVPGVRSTIMFIIARANKPLFFTAGGMYDLSLSAYSTLVKTSYSALTVLLRFRHE